MVEVRTYSIDELVDLTGFSQRNIAYYIQQGLLPKIGRRGRKTRYPQLFVDRLRFIQRVRDLQDSGRLGSVTLPRIARVIWHLVERSGEGGELPELDDRELQRIFEDDSISDERALGLGEDGEPVTVGFGKSGPYVQAAQGTASIDAEEFNSITLDEALERIHERIREQERRLIKEFEDDELQVREGRTGPYVEHRGTRARIPEEIDPTRITLEQSRELLDERRQKPMTRSASRRREKLASRAYGRVTPKAAVKQSLARPKMDVAASMTTSAGRKGLLDRLRLKRKPLDEHAQEVAARGGEASDSLEDEFYSEAAVNLDQSDPLAEADFHMAYGLHDQAADLINGALEAEPADQALISKLCEIYFVWGNRDAFVDAAKRLKDAIGESHSDDWDKVVIMGQQIAPDHHIFASTRVSRMTPAVDLFFEEEASEIGTFDLALSDSLEDFDYDTASIAASDAPLPQVDLDAIEVDIEAVRTVDLQLIEKYRVLPIARHGRRLLLATTRQTPEMAIDDIKFATGLDIEPVIVRTEQLDERIDRAIEAADVGFAALADDDFDLECLTVEDDSAEWELAEEEAGPSFLDVQAKPAAVAKLASPDTSDYLVVAEEGGDQDPLWYVPQARWLADKIERIVLESNNEQGRQTEYWTRVPITKHIEISVKGIEPDRADLVESLAEKIRKLLGLDADQPDRDDEQVF